MLNRKLYQALIPEMEFHMLNIIYAALPMCAQTEKTTFSYKDNCTLTKHTRCWTYTPKNVDDLSEVKEPQNEDTYCASTTTVVVLFEVVVIFRASLNFE